MLSIYDCPFCPVSNGSWRRSSPANIWDRFSSHKSSGGATWIPWEAGPLGCTFGVSTPAVWHELPEVALTLDDGWHGKWCLGAQENELNSNCKYAQDPFQAQPEQKQFATRRGWQFTISVLVCEASLLPLLPPKSSSCPHLSPCAACQSPGHQISPL